MIVRSQRAPMVALALIAAALLAGCSATAPSGGGATDGATGGSADAEASSRFVACLQAEGADAKILDGGSVGVRIGDPGDQPQPPDPSAGTGRISMHSDDRGVWMVADEATAFTDTTIRAAYETCQESVPAFRQPENSADAPSSMNLDAMLSAGLEFADCARENGLTEFADPGKAGTLVFPESLTEDQFRTVLAACGDTIAEVGFNATTAMDDYDFDWQAVLQDEIDGVRISIMSGTSS